MSERESKASQRQHDRAGHPFVLSSHVNEGEAKSAYACRPNPKSESRPPKIYTSACCLATTAFAGLRYALQCFRSENQWNNQHLTMETIKKKIFLLHSELSDALSSAGKAEEKSTELTGRAKEMEIKQRDLMKVGEWNRKEKKYSMEMKRCMFICYTMHFIF